MESTIMQFPLPWDEWNCSKRQAIFDVALSQHHQWAKNELEPWQNNFEMYLSGTTCKRDIGDGGVVIFGTIQNYLNYSHSYDACIGVSCDSFEYIRWMQKFENNYCVLHGTTPPDFPKELGNRVVWLNLMFPCYFIPSNFPNFLRAKIHRNESIPICVKGMGKEMTESYDFLLQAMRALENNTYPIVLYIMGGSSTDIPTPFQDIQHLVTRINEPDYFKFEKEMSRCHVMIPLLHPWDYGVKYFPSSNSKKLSGFISQAIGLKIPLLLHKELYEVYKSELTAKVWTYSSENKNDTESFTAAFKELIAEMSSLAEM
ncbi:hypothetical protein ACHAXS_004761 [Conticribra weissflogii]